MFPTTAEIKEPEALDFGAKILCFVFIYSVGVFLSTEMYSARITHVLSLCVSVLSLGIKLITLALLGELPDSNNNLFSLSIIKIKIHHLKSFKQCIKWTKLCVDH